MHTVAVSDHPFVDHLLDFCRRTAASHETWDCGVHVRAAQRCAAVAEPKVGERALDIGCGTGLVANALAAAAPGISVVGVDFSPSMLSQSRPAPGVSLLEMDARDLYLQNEAFDLVTMCQVLSYQVHPQRVVEEARRVLRRGGRLVVCCQRRSLATPGERLFFHGLDSLAASGLRIPRPPNHNALFGEPWALTRLLEAAGFTCVRTTNLVVGNHTESAAAWIDLMRGAGPYPDALVGVLGASMRTQIETALELSMGHDEEGAYRYHRAFTYAVAERS